MSVAGRRTFPAKNAVRIVVAPYNANVELIEACKAGDLERGRTAVGRGANVTTRDYDGRLALHYAAAGRHLALVELILEQAGVDLEAEDATGMRAAHMACTRWPGQTHSEADKFTVIRLLNDRGIDPGCKAHNGDTPLLCAARYGLLDVCGYLMTLPTVFLDALTHRGAQELPAHELARTWGFDDVADLILRKGTAQTTSSVSATRTPSVCASCLTHTRVNCR